MTLPGLLNINVAGDEENAKSVKKTLREFTDNKAGIQETFTEAGTPKLYPSV